MTTVDLDFETELEAISGTLLVRLPAQASAQLPSRGQVAGTATVAGHGFATVVEPDGRRGHWIRIDPEIRERAALEPGDRVEVTFALASDWPEPEVPEDLAGALGAAAEGIQVLWQDITPMARWEWVRWLQATANPATRARRVDVSISKLGQGKRRPCCFDLSSCTDPSVASSGKLRVPAGSARA